MLAGTTRFDVVAAMVGAVTGETLAAAIAVGLVRLLDASLPSDRLLLACAGALLVAGIVGGAYAGVALARIRRRREARQR